MAKTQRVHLLHQGCAGTLPVQRLRRGRGVAAGGRPAVRHHRRRRRHVRRRDRRAPLVPPEARPAAACARWSWRQGSSPCPSTCRTPASSALSDPATPFSLNLSAPQPEPPHNEVWGVPWISGIPFKGLAYTVGGRSLYWGGWSPRLLDEEMATWPAATVADLNGRYFDESSRQIGVDETNDFIFGELHHVLRQNLFGGIGRRSRTSCRWPRCRRRRC